MSLSLSSLDRSPGDFIIKKYFLLFCTLFSVPSFAEGLVSAAFCKPTTKDSFYDHIEVFYDSDKKSGIYLAELNFPNMHESVRFAAIVKATEHGEYLKLQKESEITLIKRNDPDAIFAIDGEEFSCERANW